MSAAAEYYGYLLSQGYGEHQINKFADYAKRADRGEISHNQAYRMACGAGYGNADGEGKKSFGDWMETAQEAGWIDQGLSIINNISGKGKGGSSYNPPPPPPRKSKAPLFIIGGLAVVGIGLAIYFATKKK